MTSTDNRATAAEPATAFIPSSGTRRTAHHCASTGAGPAAAADLAPAHAGRRRDLPVALADLRTGGGGVAAARRGHHQPRRARRMGSRPSAQRGRLGRDRMRRRRVRRRAEVAPSPHPDAGRRHRRADPLHHRHAVGRGTGRPIRHRLADRGLHRRDRHHRAHPVRGRRAVLLARLLRAVGVLPRCGRRHPTGPGAALVPACRRHRVDDRHLRAGPLDARRHTGPVGRGVAVRRPQLDRAGLLLPAGHRHHPDAHRAHVRARPARHATHRRGRRARMAAPRTRERSARPCSDDGSWRP